MGSPGDTPPAATGALSTSLDTKPTSRQSEATTRESPAGYPPEVIAALAERTAAHRLHHAERHEARARAAHAPASRRYWRYKAEAQRRRWERVGRCGLDWAVYADCDACGAEGPKAHRPMAITCGVERACPSCRSRIIAQRASAVLRAMEAAEADSRNEMARHGPTAAHPLGPWAWRFVTLTLPRPRNVRGQHGPIETTPKTLSRWLFPRFKRKIGEWYKIEGREERATRYFAALEMTPGRDHGGHVHMHIMWLGPYIPYPIIRRVWGALLTEKGYPLPYLDRQSAFDHWMASAGRMDWADDLVSDNWRTMRGRNGRPLTEIPWPVVDVRKAHGPADLCKYIVKDRDSDGLLDPGDIANAYAALEGVRSFRCSRGLMALGLDGFEGAHCDACGEVSSLVWCLQRMPRGPPGRDGKVPSWANLPAVPVESAWRGLERSTLDRAGYLCSVGIRGDGRDVMGPRFIASNEGT